MCLHVNSNACFFLWWGTWIYLESFINKSKIIEVVESNTKHLNVPAFYDINFIKKNV